MNVLYVCADRGIPVLGHKGASVHVRSITTAIQRLGHDVTLLARRWEEENPPPPLHRLERLPSDPVRATAKIEELLDAEEPAVVIERYSLQSGLARAVTRQRGLPLTLELNAPLAYEATRYRGLDDPLAEQREHEALRSADRIQVVSSALARYVRSVAPEVPLQWIPNGADTRAFRDADPAPVAGLRGRTIVGFVGSLKPWHGVDQLLDAFAAVHPRHPEAALVIVGAGGEEATLRDRASRPDLRDHVVWAGHVPHSRVPSILASFDLAVAPYLPADRFYFDPLKVVEYLAAGKPVIYPELGDLPELAGRAGLSYTPGSVEQLTQRLAQGLGDAALRRRLSASAALAAARLDWSTIARRLLRFATGEAVGQTSARIAAEIA
jgi:glycosyltransferase involved in cell wall biosynthesis